MTDISAMSDKELEEYASLMRRNASFYRGYRLHAHIQNSQTSWANHFRDKAIAAELEQQRRRAELGLPEREVVNGNS